MQNSYMALFRIHPIVEFDKRDNNIKQYKRVYISINTKEKAEDNIAYLFLFK